VECIDRRLHGTSSSISNGAFTVPVPQAREKSFAEAGIQGYRDPAVSGRSVRRSRFLARGSASTSAHHASVIGSCGCDHDGRLTASRACTIAATRVATSGRLISSAVKFGICGLLG
jgi:hypothetical protein